MFKQVLVCAAILVLAMGGWGEDLCPQKVQIQCQADVQKAYTICLEAAKEKGQDQQADINCFKYFNVMRLECWPCICEIAKNEGWKVRGCDLLRTME